MNRAKNIIAIVIVIMLSNTNASAGEKALSALIGGCSITLGEGWELVSRDEKETTFRAQDYGLSVMVYSAFDAAVYSGEREKVLDKYELAGLTLLRVAIDPPDEIENLEVSEYAYIHGDKYAITIMGPAAKRYRTMTALKEHAAPVCSQKSTA